MTHECLTVFEDIFEAAKSGSVEDVRHFVENEGVDVNVNVAHRTCAGTPLHTAAGFNSVDVLEYLISQGANVNAQGSCGCTPLHTASFYNPNVEILRYLVSQGADINATNKFNQTPLYQAAIALHDSVEILQYLISQGADVNSVYVLCGDNEEGKESILREAGWRTGKTSEPQSSDCEL